MWIASVNGGVKRTWKRRKKRTPLPMRKSLPMPRQARKLSLVTSRGLKRGRYKIQLRPQSQ